MRGTVNDWFGDYLLNRTQSTKLLDFISPPLTVYQAVPQGSVLSLVIFFIYVNYISLIFNNLKNILVADDSILYITDKTNPT